MKKILSLLVKGIICLCLGVPAIAATGTAQTIPGENAPPNTTPTMPKGCVPGEATLNRVTKIVNKQVNGLDMIDVYGSSGSIGSNSIDRSFAVRMRVIYNCSNCTPEEATQKYQSLACVDNARLAFATGKRLILSHITTDGYFCESSNDANVVDFEARIIRDIVSTLPTVTMSCSVDAGDPVINNSSGGVDTVQTGGVR